jgi:hypothetical protein
MIRAADFLAVNLIIGLCLSATVSGREPRLKDVLTRLNRYLTTYESELTTLVAEEHYEQSMQPADRGLAASRRTLTSEFGFLRLPGRPEWLGLRDTFAVDGQPVPDHQRGRLDRLLTEGSNPRDLARRIVDENARYNLGGLARTINVPMLALDLLGQRNRGRLSFQKRGEEQLDGRTVWAVTFDERQRPTLVKTPDGRDRPARGSALIDPADGSVLQTHLEFDDGRGGASPATAITVLYRREATLGLFVPYEMRELYRSRTTAGTLEEIDAVARYTNFRQFHTSARIVPR